MSTGIGDGIAIPHAAAAIEAPAIVIGISPAGIDFDAVDGAPVHIFFLLIGSRQAPGPLWPRVRQPRRPGTGEGIQHDFGVHQRQVADPVHI